MRGLAGAGLLVLFAVGFAGAALRERWIRLVGVIAMLAAGAGALGMVVGPASGLWVVGPLLAVLARGPGLARRRLSFDPLARRSAVIGVLAVGASLAGLQFPIAGVPRPLAMVLWNLGALGLGWTVTALDAQEVVLGTALAIAGGSALLMAASGAGWLTAAAAGALAAAPAVGFSRLRIPGLPAVLGAATGVALLWLAAGPVPSVGLADLSFTVGPPAVLAAVVVLVGTWAIGADTLGLVAIPGTLMLVAGSPALRWAALAASMALLVREARERSMAWAGLALLVSSAVLAGALDPGPRLRLITTGLAAGWLLLAGGRRVPALRASIATLYLAVQVPLLPPAAGPRFQLLAAITAAFLLALTLIEAQDVRQRLSAGLAIVGLATLTAAGTLAAVLLVVDVLVMEATAVAEPGPAWRPLRALARSGWPPTVAFAGRTLAVLAAIETSALLGVVALVLLLALLLSPLFGPQAELQPAAARVRGLAMALVSLASGLVPGWVARLGHL